MLHNLFEWNFETLSIERPWAIREPSKNEMVLINSSTQIFDKQKWEILAFTNGQEIICINICFPILKYWKVSFRKKKWLELRVGVLGLRLGFRFGVHMSWDWVKVKWGPIRSKIAKSHIEWQKESLLLKDTPKKESLKMIIWNMVEFGVNLVEKTPLLRCDKRINSSFWIICRNYAKKSSTFSGKADFS